MKVLYFLRHFPTLANNANIFMGRNDIDISPDYNREILESLKSFVLKEKIIDVYSSPLSRCIHTANLICPQATVIIDDRLIEKNLGDWQGKEKKEVKKMYPEYFTEDGKLKVTMRPPNGEDNNSFVKRIINFVNDIIDNESIEKCLIVTHGGVISCINQLTDYSNLTEGVVDTNTIHHGELYSFSFTNKLVLNSK